MPERGYIQVDEAAVAPRCVALGEECDEVAVAEISEIEPLTLQEKVSAMEQRLYELTNYMDSMFVILKGLMAKVNKKEANHKDNTTKTTKDKIEIPEGTILHGKTNGVKYYLLVKSDGFYVGKTRYQSLSAAAEGVSGVRRSGLAFWCLPDGKTIKETYKG